MERKVDLVVVSEVVQISARQKLFFKKEKIEVAENKFLDVKKVEKIKFKEFARMFSEIMRN
ncbi:hypothetical protein J7J45_07820 [Candidatus Aerophobetes bacterium]|nr:hypothetical protein [Candidatus Aerophobetes bacterium]